MSLHACALPLQFRTVSAFCLSGIRAISSLEASETAAASVPTWARLSGSSGDLKRLRRLQVLALGSQRLRNAIDLNVSTKGCVSHRPVSPRAVAPGQTTSVADPSGKGDESIGTDSGTAASGGLRYDAVVFDMDGTMTVSNIDFVEMRERTGIPQGDLFTVMEGWEDPARIKQAYDVIMEMEARACLSLALMPGLEEVLALLRERSARLALVTRNTTVSVDAFFAKLGEEWRDAFSIILTREFRYVKPDKRLLIHVASEWGLPPGDLLMVGDSREDVECGNAAGTATCLVQGGGNEVSSSPTPSGAEPTFTVASLHELREILAEGTHAEASHVGTKGKDLISGGGPLAGLRMFDALFAAGVIKGAYCSYPRLAGAAGGLSASTYPGDVILHLGCGDGGLTKLLASQGLRVVGCDPDLQAVQAAMGRGLAVRHLLIDKARDGSSSIRKDTLGKTGAFDAVLACSEDCGQIPSRMPWGARGDVNEIWRVLRLGGHFACEHSRRLGSGEDQGRALEKARADLQDYFHGFLGRGFQLTTFEVNIAGDAISSRLVIEKPGFKFLDMHGPLFV